MKTNLLTVSFCLLLCGNIQLPAAIKDVPVDLPVAIEASVINKTEGAMLSISVVNRYPKEIVISTQFLNSSNCQVWESSDNVKEGKFELRQLIPQIRQYGGDHSVATITKEIAGRLKGDYSFIKLGEGKSYTVEIPLSQALEAAKTASRNGRIIAQLGFSNLILGGVGMNEKETVELFLTRFYTPNFVFQGGSWKPLLDAK